ncbi:SDR family NAD(P)-dependent oxidoreductase [Corynebacterium epidermidicanis]|uniref:Short-chain alcohol dehydrogenase n=1 Tax=Corynebacterium epidermidicanis TaxID=1050174 RepID=A0A0G3GUR8_9CORY|nr:SDR family NAD(P)-dependent oxidoreductase [Corynebacterium epidermidicanis]AKK04255.1 dehydrogenase of unknown specificity, short-chain alcohol dehydrogenase like [Corynebacterium epidermidicanis]
MRSHWTASDLPDLHGETWLITGATRGLGLATARAASARGAHIILGVRDAARGAEVARELGDATVIPLDLSQLSSVRAATEHVPRVDVLINNAGSTTSVRSETPDGFEWHLGVNLLGPFLFTNLIAEQVRRRVVIVTSVTHHRAKFDFDDPHFTKRPWSQARAYSQSKLADLLWAHALQSKASFDVQTSHPGWSDTTLANPARSSFGQGVVSQVARRLANSSEQGALTTLFAATQDLPPVSLVGPSGLGELRGYPRLVRASESAKNPQLAERLWAFAEAATS